MTPTITGLAIGIVVGLLVLAALAPEALCPKWVRASYRLAVEYVRAQTQADRSTDWTSDELTSMPPAADIQRTVPVAQILGHPVALAYAPGAHRLGGHHERATFGTVTGSYAQVARWTADTTSSPVLRLPGLATVGA